MSEVDQTEIDRVDRIHYWLDSWSKRPISGVYRTPDDVVFQANEIRAWPELKAKMIARLSGADGLAVNRHCGVVAVSRSSYVGGILAQRDVQCFTEHERANVARGLCLYRGSRAFLEATGAKVIDGHFAEVSEHIGPTAAQVREAYGKADPYAEHRKKLDHRVRYGGPGESLEHRVAVEQGSLDVMSGRRARLVAALKADMGRPVTPPRFPHVGKDDRVFGYRRWSDK